MYIYIEGYALGPLPFDLHMAVLVSSILRTRFLVGSMRGDAPSNSKLVFLYDSTGITVKPALRVRQYHGGIYSLINTEITGRRRIKYLGISWFEKYALSSLSSIFFQSSALFLFTAGEDPDATDCRFTFYHLYLMSIKTVQYLNQSCVRKYSNSLNRHRQPIYLYPTFIKKSISNAEICLKYLPRNPIRLQQNDWWICRSRLSAFIV